MMLQSESGILAQADARVFRILMSVNRTARRLMAADRTMAGAYARVATLRRLQQAKETREHARVERELAKALSGSGIAAGWGQTFVVSMPTGAAPRASGSSKAAARTSTSTRALRAYAAPLRDSRGRVALYMDFKYRGFGSKGWRAGLAADHIEYIMRELALEVAAAQVHEPISNMGETVEEIIACWHALEAIEEGYRANAKVQYRIVWNLPHELDAAQRRALVSEFCDRTFDRLGLPYVAAIHEPDAKSDERNYHAHICFSTRPCERIGDHQWAISEEKVNGLTDKPGLKLIRALGAAHMNRASRAAGLSTLFTHQSYAERGIDAERQAHIGPAAMAAHDRGEHLGAIARNAVILERNEAAVARQRVEQQLDASLHLQRLLEEADRTASLRTSVRAWLGTARALLRTTNRVMIPLLAAEKPATTTGGSIAQVSELRARAMLLRRQTATPRQRPLTTPAILIRQGASRLQSRLASAKIQHAAGTSRAAIEQIGIGAGAVRARLSAPQPSSSRETDVHLDRLEGLITGARSVSGEIGVLGETNDGGARARAVLQDAESRLTRQKMAEASEREEKVRASILQSAAVVCDVENGKFRADLSALADHDRMAFGSLDRVVQRKILLERYAADQERKREEDARKRADDETRERNARSAALHSAQVAQACRIILNSKSRPYRRDGRTIYGDWSAMEASERDIVNAIGLKDPALKNALVERVKADDRHDARLQAEFKPPARPVTAPLPQAHENADGRHSQPASGARVPRREVQPVAHPHEPATSLEKLAAARPEMTSDALLIHAAKRRRAWIAGWNEARRLDAPAAGNDLPSSSRREPRHEKPVARPARRFPGYDGPSR